MSQIRELRVTDIRCSCGAGPSDHCESVLVSGRARRLFAVHGGGMMVHPARYEEFVRLAEDGWQWQEVDPRDAGARKEG